MTPAEEARALLAAAGEETQYRTVASRAYYAAYNNVRAFAEPLGFVPVKTGEDHRSLVEFLKNSNKDLLTRIGVRLVRLPRIRVQADYEPSASFSRGLAEDAVRDMEQIMDWLRMLSPP
jgi:uncharacterized protein (UPF0332 family)